MVLKINARIWRKMNKQKMAAINDRPFRRNKNEFVYDVYNICENANIIK